MLKNSKFHLVDRYPVGLDYDTRVLPLTMSVYSTTEDATHTGT